MSELCTLGVGCEEFGVCFAAKHGKPEECGLNHAPPPPIASELPAGYQLRAGLTHSTILPDLDFETYSEAGFRWDDATGKWECLPGAPGHRKGLEIVGAAVYATHPSTEILSLKYNLKDGRGDRHWKPGDPPPQELFDYIAAGGLLEAHNSGFEHWIWNQCAVPKLGWPPLPLRQLRCSMAKARAHAMPAPLGKLTEVLRTKIQKDKDGDRLLKKFSIPQNPTKKQPRLRIRPEDDPEDAARLYNYNGIDIASEAEASALLPDLGPEELEYWLCDQAINYRGVAVDMEAVNNCIAIMEQAFQKYNSELAKLTGGAVEQGSQTERLKGWLLNRGVQMFAMDSDAVEETLKDPWIPDDARRALEIREKIGSASVKKLYAFRNTVSKWGRIHDLINYHAARTGRDGGKDAQTQNLPKAGPEVFKCGSCARYFGIHTHVCPWCETLQPPSLEKLEWHPAVVDDVLEIIATRSLDLVERFFGDAFENIVGCLRGLLVAAPGHDLIASDFSAIEGVVTAALAGEEWRLEVFRTHGKIYEMSASKVSGVPLEEFLKYKKETGRHRPERQSIGKCLELACGFGGWVGATKAANIRMDRFFTDDQIAQHILAWRAESPAIVELWGGQFRGHPFRAETIRAEYFGLEGAAIQAILNPGTTYTVQAPHKDSRPIRYVMHGDVLYCILPSGRPLAYHRPRLEPGTKGPWAQHGGLSITFWGWNSNPKMGPMGWCHMDTYGGKLTENVVQAVARDILRDAVIRLMRAAYPVVLRVHDEIVAEVPKGFGSVEEFEAIMSVMPSWAQGWPVFARGGWRGYRYRKD